MNFNFAKKMSLTHFQHCALTALVGACLLSVTFTGSVHAFDKIIPMGAWAEHINVELEGKPLLVHLRTGYERTVSFPEPVVLHSINDQPAANLATPALPNCRVYITANTLGFEPLKRFKQQQLKARGLESGRLYTLIVNSSPTGKRQPIQIIQ